MKIFFSSARPVARLFLGLPVALALIAVTASAASGHTQAASATKEALAARLSGAPIKVMTYSSINSPGVVWDNIRNTAFVAGKWINAHGGIAGHPVKVIFCDDRGDAVHAAACARQAVSDHVVAAVGSFNFAGDTMMPILQKANIANFGLCCAVSPAELSFKNSFPLGNGNIWAVGLAMRAVDDGCKKVGAVVIDGAQALTPLIENAMKFKGQILVKTVILPQTSTDYSPQVAQATSGTDCLVMVVPEVQFTAWMPAFAQSGSTERLYGPQGNFTESVVKGFEKLTNGDVVGGSYPDISTPPFAQYRQALAQYHAPGWPEPVAARLDYNSLGGLGTWAAYMGFRQVADAIKGPITGKSFLQLAGRTKVLNLHGMLPVLNLTKPWVTGPPGWTRLFNRSVVYSKFKNGRLVPLSSKFVDVSKAANG